MMIAMFPVLLIVLGLLLWFASSNAKVSEAGRICFACGILILTWVLSRHVVRIG